VPLEEATTPSLDALKAYSLGDKTFAEKGPAAALPYFLRAVQIDPNFATGYASIGDDYTSLAELGRAADYYRIAFRLRDHSSEREKLSIAAHYYFMVTGELEKAALAFEETIQAYPRELKALGQLGNTYSALGRYEKARDVYARLLGELPDNAAPYVNLNNSLLALWKLDEARKVVNQAYARKLDNYIFHDQLYAIDFLAGDSGPMAQELEWFRQRPEENFGLALESDTDAYRGRLHQARDLTRKSVDSAIRVDSKENGAIWLENAALWEAALGNTAQARQAIAAGLKLAPASPGVASEAALASAMAGDATEAESLARRLAKEHPLDTQIQSLWLPATASQLALNRKKPLEALEHLQTLSSSVEFGQIMFLNNISCLYPTYIHGESYLAAAQGEAAAAEFKKILDHSGIVWNCWTGALAHLGLARAYALQSRTADPGKAQAARSTALAEYKEFFEIWKDADADIPVLKKARAEYDALRRRPD
jgi:tetratricopeptide (TPR) repeat protein